mmetsp:Transcript_17898/g.32474  ORF Transcript_17898/g.32474 Transcript_17898/m.32474 type:complete len:471 (-) Transcript_17898:313-1725(-)
MVVLTELSETSGSSSSDLDIALPLPGDAACLRVVFSLLEAKTEWGESMLVVGNSSELGGWSSVKAVQLKTDAKRHPEWRSDEVHLKLPVDSSFVRESGMALEFKFLRDRRSLGKGFQWEDSIPNRKVSIPVSAHPGVVWVIHTSAFDAAGESRLARLVKEAPPTRVLSVTKGFDDWYHLVGEVPLGRGGFSTVWKCQPNRFPGLPAQNNLGIADAAVKRMDKEQMPPRMRRFLFGCGNNDGEIQLHHSLRHRNIVELYEVFDDARMVSMVLEYCAGGDLLELTLRNKAEHGKGIPEVGVASVARQLLAALAYVHKKNIVHRDVKCENVFMVEAMGVVPMEKATYKLGDFGLAARILPDEVLIEQVGSPSTSAPEVVCGRPYSTPTDIWSAGATCFTALAAKRPFEATTYAQMAQLAHKGRVTFTGKYWDALSPLCKAFLRRLLQIDPLARSTASELLHGDNVWLWQGEAA